MPNLYITEDEIKQVAPDAIRTTTTQYDKLFITLAERISRWVDNHTQRMFYPFIDTRFYSVSRNRGHHGGFNHGFSGLRNSEFEDLWIDDLIEITSVNVSENDGSTYTALAASDYIAMHGQDFNSEKSYTLLKIDQNGTIGSWPVGQRSVKIVGTWNFTDDRGAFFEDTLDAVADATGINAAATEVTLTDVDGLDLHGLTPRLSPGNLLRMESEIVEVTATDTGTNKATITRGVNGSVAAAHANAIQIDKFVAPQPLKQACIIQAVHQFKRGQGGFGDAVANLDMGRIIQVATIDAEALVLLQAYTKLEFG